MRYILHKARGNKVFEKYISIMAEHYFGMLDGSTWGIYIYKLEEGTIVEVQKGGIASSDLPEMFQLP